jgi:ribonuclease Z
LPELAKELGVPFGPVRKDLVNGKSITLEDGRLIHPDDVLGPVRPGISIALTGDAGRIDNLVDAVKGVDLLVCEATYLERDKEMARRFGHLTAAEAARLACEVGARQLVLTHLSQRYRIHEMLEEARMTFPNTIIARDFDHFTVTRDAVTMNNEELKNDPVDASDGWPGD